jgi:hypothetical protein
MDWAAMGAVSEVIAAVAVVISLAYLAAQVRQANKIARATTRNAIAESAQSLTRDIIDDREMAEIFVKHLNGEKLDAVEALRMTGRCYRDMRHWENIYYQVREGLLTAEEWSGFRKNLAALFAVEAYREYWEHEAELYSEAFQAQIESIIPESSGVQTRLRFAERFDNGPSQEAP